MKLFTTKSDMYTLLKPPGAESDVKGKDELEACCLKVSGIAGAWWECDFNQKKKLINLAP
jgi:hypothetical protein